MGRGLKTGWLLLPFLLISACIRDGSDPSGKMLEIPFRTLCGPEVRSVLTSRDIETKRTSVTLAAYRGGVLETARFFSGDGGKKVLKTALTAAAKPDLLETFHDAPERSTDCQSAAAATRRCTAG